MDRASVDHVLSTTRAVRKRLDLDRPVPPEIVEECLELAVQAPTGSNYQLWRFLVVTDAEKRAALGRLYRDGFQACAATVAANAPSLEPGDPRLEQRARVASSAGFLVEHMGRVPLMVIPCMAGRPEGAPLVDQAGWWGSILPAAWSFLLALRARGLGSAWTTAHLAYEAEANRLLGLPEGFTQAALLPVAWFRGADFRPALRIPARSLTWWNEWGRTR